jgi:hypothetical protein
MYIIWSGKLQRHRWEDNIEMDPREVGCDSVGWILLVQDRVQLWTSVDIRRCVDHVTVSYLTCLLTHSLHGARYYLNS